MEIKIDMELMVFNFQRAASESLSEENCLGKMSQLNLNKLEKMKKVTCICDATIKGVKRISEEDYNVYVK